MNASSRLAFEGARHGVGIFGNDGEQHLRRLVGPMRALLPIAHGAEREMKPRSEFFLSELHRRLPAAADQATPNPARTACRVAGRTAIAVPHTVAHAAAKTTSTLDENLADMARQLEAALRKPNAAVDATLTETPTPAAPAQAPAVEAETTTPSAARAPRPIEPKPQRPDAKPKQSTIPTHSLEHEFAKILGRTTKY